MKITCITSNLPRHNYLINSLAGIRCKLFVIQECQSYFPGLINDIHYKINNINELNHANIFNILEKYDFNIEKSSQGHLNMKNNIYKIVEFYKQIGG